MAETVGYWKLNEDDDETGSGGVKNHSNDPTSTNAGQGSNVVKDLSSSPDTFGYFYKTEQADKFNYTQTNGYGIDIVDVDSSLTFAADPVFITSSRWPLDARNDFTKLPLDLSTSSFNHTVPGKCFDHIITSHATRGEGIFQNDYNTFGCGANFQHAVPPVAPIYSRRVPQKPIDHYVGTVTVLAGSNFTNGKSISFVTINGATITATVANTTTDVNTDTPTFQASSNNNTTAANLKKCLDANNKLTVTVENNKEIIKQPANALTLSNNIITLTNDVDFLKGVEKVDFAAVTVNEYLAGEAEWKAASQLGSNPFSTDFEKHAENYRQVGQDHSLVPEFIISNHVEDVVLNAENDFTNLSNRDGFLSVTGAVYNASSGDLSVNENFYKTYGISDMMKYFGVTMEEIEDSNLGNPTKLTLRCKAALKFTPYRGFYPAERVQQITEMFARGYMQEFDFETTQTKPAFVVDQETLLKTKVRANMQQSIKPLFAPGVLMNSIKAGMAVDYPLFGAASLPSVQELSSSSGVNSYQTVITTDGGTGVNDRFHISVNGDYMAIGIPTETGPTTGNGQEGVVKIYKLTDTSTGTKEWTFLTTIEAPRPGTPPEGSSIIVPLQFGEQVFMSENYLAVTAPDDMNNAGNSITVGGVVFIFERSGDDFITPSLFHNNSRPSVIDFRNSAANVVDSDGVKMSKRGQNLAGGRDPDGGLKYIDSDYLILSDTLEQQVWIWQSRHIAPGFALFTNNWSFENQTAGADPSVVSQILIPPTAPGLPSSVGGTFGHAVAFSGNTMLISDPGRTITSDMFTAGGIVHVYKKTQGQFIYNSSIQPSEATPGARFGYSVAISEDESLLVVGAPVQISSLDQPETMPAIHIYTKNSDGQYSLLQKIDYDITKFIQTIEHPPISALNSSFGIDVKIYENSLIIVNSNNGLFGFAKNPEGKFVFQSSLFRDKKLRQNHSGRSFHDIHVDSRSNKVIAQTGQIRPSPDGFFEILSAHISENSSVGEVDRFKRLAISPASSFATEYTGQIRTITGSIVNNSIDSGVPRLSGSVYKRVTFEEMMNPDSLKSLVIEDQEPHPSASIYHADKYTGKAIDFPFRFGELDATNNEIDIGVSSFSPNKTLAETLKPYRLAINNFCAETINFFLKDGKISTLESANNVYPYLKSGQAYKMRLEVVNSNTRMYDRHSAFGPPVDEGTIKLLSDGKDTVFKDQHAYSPFVPPFLDPGSTPYVDITFTPTETKNYTLDEIRDGATYEYRNFSTIPEGSSSNSNYLNAMSLSASINLDSFVTYKPLTDDAGADIEKRARWVIQPRWETPVLNFISSEGSALNLSSEGDVKTVKARTSPWQKRNWDNFYVSKPKPSDIPYLTSSIGMWHQAGTIPRSTKEGYTLRIKPHPDVTRPENQLADQVGFTKRNTISANAGQLRNKKVVYEAVIAIPFIEPEYSGGDIRYFDLTEELLAPAAEFNKSIKERYATAIAGLDSLSAEFREIKANYERVYNQPGQAPQDVIAYQLRMQEKYVIPEEFAGKMMYVFQYSAEFTKQDLANIWQNVAPVSDFSAKDLRYSTVDNRQGISGTSQDIQYVSNFLNGMGPTEREMDFKNSKIRWVVLKVKQRAMFDLNQVKRNSLRGPNTTERLEIDNSRGTFNQTPELEDEKYSFNWPYDFFSIVELVKLEGKVDIFDSLPAMASPPIPEEE